MYEVREGYVVASSKLVFVMPKLRRFGGGAGLEVVDVVEHGGICFVYEWGEWMFWRLKRLRLRDMVFISIWDGESGKESAEVGINT